MDSGSQQLEKRVRKTKTNPQMPKLDVYIKHMVLTKKHDFDVNIVNLMQNE